SILDVVFFFQAEDGIRDRNVTGVQTCALPISRGRIAPSRAVDSVRDAALRERARLATAQCALEANDPVGASRAVAGVTESRDGEIGRASWRERGEVEGGGGV